MNCKNCNTALREDFEYCSICGGKVVRKRLTLKNLFEHLSETFFNYDNKLLRTIIDLCKKPEEVISTYIDGVRKRYVNPISLFGLSLTISGLSVFLIQRFYLEYFDIVAWMSSLEIFNNPLSQEALANYSAGDTMEYSSLIYSAIVPVFGLISWIVFWDKKYNFTEHIIIYLYSMSLISIFSVIAGQIILLIIPTYYIPFIFITYPIILLYHCFLLKRIFNLSISELLVKTILFLAIFFVLYIILAVISFVLGVLTGQYNLGDFKPKQ
ncbi:DUF3667 domain-containing protein [Winogradskyella sp. DF17]|uniref:DUF3667 domain-containing protein n=1 Tax=Winogradskyella pelagia TaxID=2819984 RepID=A0ABS3T0M2_9FLAO|nr:DUF3667 domain-containing protein [Winogradskyella sp. DF17]MBO3116292.1 DUF3667 domain-containing protein [Winogradskyella sp. DF17]